MNLLVYIKLAISNLIRSKYRAVLALLGISIGIASVIAMYSISDGFNKTISGEFASLGSDTILIYPFSFNTEGGGITDFVNIKLNDIEALEREYSQDIEAIVPTVGWNSGVSYKKNSFKGINLRGTAPEFILVGGKSLSRGSFFGISDLKKASNVCVLGSLAAERIFSSQDPVDKTILINGIPFKVIGVLDKMPRGMGFSWGLDGSIIMPYTTLQSKICGKRNAYIWDAKIVPARGSNPEELVEDIKFFLIKKLKIKSSEKVGFTVELPEALGKVLEQMINEMFKFLIMTASISLLIGGLGIMNIMLVSVTDRIKEIGIRMSVGATRADIIEQFLIEAVIMCIVGGIIGIFLSYPLAYMVNKFLEYPTNISFVIMIIALLYACGVGIFFGLYPAYAAAKLDPVEAIRYE